MRIICDHCGHPISGRVQKMAGNLNFHPDCLTEVVRGTQPQLTPISENYQSSAKRWTDRDRRKLL